MFRIYKHIPNTTQISLHAGLNDEMTSQVMNNFNASSVGATSESQIEYNYSTRRCFYDGDKIRWETFVGRCARIQHNALNLLIYIS